MAMGRATHLAHPHVLLIVNPRAGGGGLDASEIEHQTEIHGIEGHVLSAADDLRVVARAATDRWA